MVKHRMVACLVLALMAGSYCLWPNATQPNLIASHQESPEILPDPRPCWLGVSSCTAAACHGGGLKGSKGSEYDTFAASDPHARAYKVLLTERSAQMIRNLNDPKSPAAQRNPLCLACHAVNPETICSGPRFTMVDGVGCENCHGPAQKWLSAHYQPAWQALTYKDKEALGFHNTKDLQNRAQGCVGCHVGHGDVDVNHDLIAAGHPRLNFEFASYLAIYPKHWSEKQEKARYPDWEARAWKVGQLTSAQAALELLAHRATTQNKPWPELAEFNCFACHKKLPGSNFQPRQQDPKRLGTLVGGDWYYSMLGQIVPGSEEEKSLRDLQSALGQRKPNQTDVTRRVHQLAVQLQGPLDQVSREACLTPDVVRGRLDHLMEEEKQGGNWDQQVQRYLGLAALTHALSDLAPDRRDARLKEYLLKRREELAFPAGQNSPRH
jgi:hypothetical protein